MFRRSLSSVTAGGRFSAATASSSSVFAAALPTPYLFSSRRLNSRLSGSPLPLPEKDQLFFNKYNELDLPNAGRIDGIRKAGLTGRGHEWIATEKVHGTNYSAVYQWAGPTAGTGWTVKYAKRSGIMDPNEHFFCCQALNPDFERWMPQMLTLLQRKFNMPNIARIQAYGELFGGKFQHPQLKKTSEMKCVINGRTYWVRDVEIQEEDFPQYHYDLKWSCFDIVFGPSLLDRKQDRTLTFDEYTDVCSQIPGLLYAKPLVRGTLDQCLSFDVENFETPLPAILGLGDYPLKKNYAEGIVVRHQRHGAPDLNELKVSTCIKVRSSIFMEMKHPEMAQEMRQAFFDTVRLAAVKNAGGVATPDLAALLPAVEATASRMLLNLVAESRLSNTLSKIGPHPILSGEVTQDDLALMLAKDALKDFLKELDEPSLLNTTHQIRRTLCKNVFLESKKLVAKEWASIVKRYEGKADRMNAATAEAAAE